MGRWVIASRRHESIEECRRTARATERSFRSLFQPYCRTVGIAGDAPDSDYFAAIFDMPSGDMRIKLHLVPQSDSIVEAEVLHEPSSATRVIQVLGRNGPLSNVTVTPLYDGIRRPTTVVTAATDAQGHAHLRPRARKSPDGAAIASAPGYWSRWVNRLGSNSETLQITLEPLPRGPLGWWHSVMGAYGAPQRSQRHALCEACVGVGVIDSGCGPHLSLAHVVDHGAYFYGSYSANGEDTTGHGTHVCGLIGARPSRRVPGGYVGISPAVGLHSLRVGDASSGIANQVDIALALRDLVLASVKVVMIGLAAKQPSTVLEEAITVAANAGVLCIAAAGNSGDTVYYPAAFENVVAVGAVGLQGWGPRDAVIHSYQPDESDGSRLGQMDGRQLFIPRFSPGPEPAVTCVGPGVGIISCAPDRSGFVERSGTSMAAALVSGALATMLARSERYLSLSACLERADYAHALLDVICRDLGTSRLLQGRGIPMVSTPSSPEARNRTLALFHRAADQSAERPSQDQIQTFSLWPRPLGTASVAELVPVASTMTRMGLYSGPSRHDDRLETGRGTPSAPPLARKSDMTLGNSRGRKPMTRTPHGRFSSATESEPEANAPAKNAALPSARELLALEAPWDIFRVSARFGEESKGAARYDVWVFDSAHAWPCPFCRAKLTKSSQTDWQVFKQQRDKTDTYVHVKIPIVQCPQHGRQELDVPWTRDPVRWRLVSAAEPDDIDSRRRNVEDAAKSNSASDSTGETSGSSRMLDSWRRITSRSPTLY